jgi:hypothetical protein
MIRLTALYPAKDGETFNYDYYFNNHHKLLVSRLKPEGLVSCEFDKGVSDPAGARRLISLSPISSLIPSRTCKKRSRSMGPRSWATFPTTRRSSRSCK